MLKINYLIQRIDLGHSFLKENWSLQIFLASRITVLWENVCLAALNLANRSWIDNVYKVFLLLQCLSFVRLLFQPLWYKTGLCKMTFLSSFAWMFYFYPHGSFLCSITYARNDLFFLTSDLFFSCLLIQFFSHKSLEDRYFEVQAIKSPKYIRFLKNFKFSVCFHFTEHISFADFPDFLNSCLPNPYCL